MNKQLCILTVALVVFCGSMVTTSPLTRAGKGKILDEIDELERKFYAETGEKLSPEQSLELLKHIYSLYDQLPKDYDVIQNLEMYSHFIALGELNTDYCDNDSFEFWNDCEIEHDVSKKTTINYLPFLQYYIPKMEQLCPEVEQGEEENLETTSDDVEFGQVDSSIEPTMEATANGENIAPIAEVVEEANVEKSTQAIDDKANNSVAY